MHGGHGDDPASEVPPSVREEVVRAARPRPAPRGGLPPRPALRRVRPPPAAAAARAACPQPRAQRPRHAQLPLLQPRPHQRELIQVVLNIHKESISLLLFTDLLEQLHLLDERPLMPGHQQAAEVAGHAAGARQRQLHSAWL